MLKAHFEKKEYTNKENVHTIHEKGEFSGFLAQF